MGMRKVCVGVSLILVLIAGCASSPFTRNESPGQRFERAMKEYAEKCAKAKLKPNDTACDILKLKPADPLATEEDRFAHSIKIPNPLPEDSGYRPGMTPEQYFDHLCKTEAGEFIYKTVENVEGLYMMRPRKEATDDELSHLYALEDPYGHVTEGSGGDARELLVRRGAYVFLEERTAGQRGSSTYSRYVAVYEGNRKTLKQEDTTEIRSQYGYAWRGIPRPHDRELGIAGGELIVLDIQNGEVLAVRRGFIRSGAVRNKFTGVWWLGGHACPKGKEGRTDFYTFDFLREVLKPAGFRVEKEGDPNVAK
ncbi:MAG: hypothetical protein ABL970_01240 [Nitrospira sp.]